MLSNSNLPIILFFFIVAVFVVFSYFYSTKQKVIRMLNKLPNKRIGNLKVNEFSKITGKVRSITSPLIAPYSKKKCIYYALKIEQKKKSGKNYKWKILVNEEKIQDFLIEDKDDSVLVLPNQEPKNYIQYIKEDRVLSGSMKYSSKEIQELLNRFKIKKELLRFNKQIRFKEIIIEIGEEITVAGTVTHKILDRQQQQIEGYNYSKIIALKAADLEQLIITNLPNIKSKRNF